MQDDLVIRPKDTVVLSPRAPSAPPALDLEYELRLQRLRFARRFAATPFSSPPTLENGSNDNRISRMRECIWRWDFWNDLIHSAVLVNENPWRKALSEYEEKRYPYYLPAPQDFAVEVGIEDRIAAAKRVTNGVLALSVCTLNSEPFGTKSGSDSVEWNRLIWRSVSKCMELWPATLGKRGRPRQLQGRLRRELEPFVWVRVDVQRRDWAQWKREPLVRCWRSNDQIDYCDAEADKSSNAGTFDYNAPSPDSDVRNLLSLLGSRTLLSSKSLLLLPPLNSFPHDTRSRVPHQLGMEPLTRPEDGGMAVPKSWLEFSQSMDYIKNAGRREHWGESQPGSVEDAWLRDHRITLMLGICEA